MRHIFFAIAAYAAMTSCTSSPASDRIDAAEYVLQSGDMDGARRGAENVIAAKDTASLTAGELCRLAMVYATVGEDSLGNEVDVAMAARCIRRALAKDSTAVDSFIHTLPIDQRPLMALAVQLCSGTQGADIAPYEQDTDTINPD
ncbi:MAG: hypothetical protein K2F77_02500 [Muribaculaceae bacterium]|nr:hypothetical protein [Muribaculaceae bacterium]